MGEQREVLSLHHKHSCVCVWVGIHIQCLCQKFDSHKKMADHVSRLGKRKTVQFIGMFVWIIVFYFYDIFLPLCIL